MIRQKIIRLFFLICGIISLVLGILGIFLPILPTTPFLLLSSALFLKSSKRLYLWLIHHRFLGNYVYHYMRFKAIRLSTKVLSLSLLWVTITISIIIVQSLYLQAGLIIVAFGVTWHLLCLKTLTDDDIQLGNNDKDEWVKEKLKNR